MPYDIVNSTAGGKKGYRVMEKKNGKKVYFSKEALPLAMAKKQRTAIIISEIKRGKPEKYTNGGKVKNDGFKPVPGNRKDFGDVIPAILEPGELVIPVKHVKKVEKFLKKNNIKLSGMN